MKTMTDPRCGKVSRANDTDGHCTACHMTWSGEIAFTAHQHIADGVLTCEDPETATTPNGDRKWWPRQRPGTTDGVAWGLGEPGWRGLGPTVAPVDAITAESVEAPKAPQEPVHRRCDCERGHPIDICAECGDDWPCGEAK